MAQENIRKSGSAKEFKNDKDGGTTIDAPVLGVVKDNVDPTKSGRIQVYIASHSGPDPDDNKSWVTVSYLSPFYGVTSPGTNNYDGPDTSGLGKFVGNPQSYGFWTGAPDIGTEVICVFIDGRIEQGYYIGCVPQSGLLQMTPAVGAATTVIPNSEESKTYGGADRLPTSEVNYSNPTVRNSPTITTDPKPVHSYQTSILSAQGIVRDNIRGVISSSAQRETPSKVFGISTPGNPIYSGGYNSSTIRSSAKGASSEKLEIIGRTGGHSFVMDDGTLDGQDQLIRLRTSSGHQIMMNDSGETLFITHANGQSWIELGKEGTIDLFATNSVNIRTQGDLNLHADRDVNINAKKKLNIFADDINVESDKNINFRAGINFAGYATQKYTVKSGGDLSLLAGGAASLAASGVAYVNGNKVNLNTGNTGTVPAEVPSLTKINHIDTAYSTEKGWMFPAPTALVSVVSRAPTHQPYIGSGKGVDVKTSSIASPSGVQTTSGVNKINDSTPNTPVATVTPSIASTVPTQTNTTGKIFNPSDVSTLAAQQAVTNRQRLLSSGKSNNTTTTTPSTAGGLTVGGNQNVGSIFPASVTNALIGQVTRYSQLRYGEILPVTSGITVTQATASGSILKPGSRPLLQARLDQGMPLERALEGLTTGNFGAKSPLDVINNNGVQLQAISNSINQSTTELIDRGILTGEESPAQAGGVVLAASNYGTKVVTGIISGIGNVVSGTITAAGNVVAGTINAVSGTVAAAANVVSSTVNKISDITDTISSGKFAGKLSDAISNGITGLATSISNTVNGIISGVTNTIRGIGNQISSITNNLASTLRNAFDTVEKSYKNLTADKPNTLGGSTAAVAVNVDTPSAKYEAAEAELENAEANYLTARKAYRNDPSEENTQALQAAEAAVSAAKQKGASAASSIITDPISRFTSGIKSVFSGNEESKPVTTSNSGMNALPGGVDSAVNQTTSAGNNVLTGIKNAATTVSTAAVATITNTAKLAGNLVKNTINAVTATVSNTVNAVANTVSNVANAIQNTASSIKTAASSIVSKIQTQLSSLGNAGGQVKSATQSVETYNTAPIVAKTASLLGDPRIPNPEVVYSPPEFDKTNQQIDEQIRKQSEALSKLEEAKDEVRYWKNSVAEWERIRTPGSEIYSPTATARDQNDAQEQLKKALNRLRQAESEYNKTLRA